MVKFNFNSSLATVIAVVPTVCSMAQEKPMNVIFIMSDDHTSQLLELTEAIWQNLILLLILMNWPVTE